MARLFKPAIVGELSVPGRKTGEWRSISAVMLQHDGQRYLVSAYGDTEWSRNLRAAGKGRFTRRGKPETFTAVEVPVAERPPLIKAYLEQFGKLPMVARTFQKLPDPADHPTFRIT